MFKFQTIHRNIIHCIFKPDMHIHCTVNSHVLKPLQQSSNIFWNILVSWMNNSVEVTVKTCSLTSTKMHTLHPSSNLFHMDYKSLIHSYFMSYDTWCCLVGFPFSLWTDLTMLFSPHHLSLFFVWFSYSKAVPVLSSSFSHDQSVLRVDLRVDTVWDKEYLASSDLALRLFRWSPEGSRQWNTA